MQFADFHNRFGAFITDWHIRTVPIALWGFAVFARWFPEYWQAGLRGEAGRGIAWAIAKPVIEQPVFITTGIASLVAYLLYHPVVELVMHGDSPGKRMMGISVVTLSGGKPTAWQVLLRNFWRAVEFLPVAYLWGFFAMLRSPENARTGDRLAGTRVVLDAKKIRR
ncbi:MAG: RDD family protein [Proteobacteria bacterium]|nr:RDD family protein [Pseudomonadota bacterium]